MKRRICIVGTGTAGLHLAYALKKEFDVTVISHRTAEQIRNGRIQSTQVHFGSTIERERRFSMPKWSEHTRIESIHMTIGQQKLFAGMLAEPALSVDQRFYFSHCLEELIERKVPVLFKKINNENLGELIEEFDLVIDCTGKNGPLFPFPIEKDFSPFQTPQRKCIVGYFRGIKPLTPQGINVTILPGEGEMFEIPALTDQGPVTILFIMAIQEKRLDIFKAIRSSDEFTLKIRTVLQSFFPEIASRIVEESFALNDEKGILQTAITPVIRKPYTIIQNKLAVGCGDSVFLNDPITGQGCNLSSYCAEKLYETLIEFKDEPWNSQLGESYWDKTKPLVKQVTEWTNAMTMPMPEHVIDQILQGSGEQAKADRIAGWFADPSTAYQDIFQGSKIQ
ncbi:styrene monooxygenase [Bacillus sp. CMF21]|uniref:styrene monooxygenase/indole monooxygenase family protein n=1 Tax=Metabacillus dongyingensis TaxID=2874282 RepID=UPI001CBEB649|nr:styrene monooxygenase/indole monooxygenase family protein [Metabacillus dongyingensis]UAL50418.1 styrene monooxygenase [Metabacillus dongyingensis]USK26676.1 styrene monooxygenase [Bacillus sp. CMF21]